jgi:hypothetical protein
MIQKTTITPPQLKGIEMLSKLMDSQFTIPGTNIKFGLDSLIGLIPGIGDFSTFIVSGYMVHVLAQNGASGNVLARMILNIIVDALFGSIPVLGDIFDIGFKANQKNMQLMRAHYTEGRHRGGAWKVIIPVLLLVLCMVAGLVWLGIKFFSWIISLF